jgi:restriction endonuclease S subunit
LIFGEAKNMATLSVTNITELKGTRRLDAEYYQPIYLKLEKELLKVECKRLKNMAFVTDGIHSSIEYDPNSQIRIISAQSVRDNDFDLSANTRISVEQHQRNLRTSLKIDDIILSSVGTIGNTAVVSADMLPSNADRHVGIVRLRDKKFNAFYVSTFLNSKYGRFQTFRESTGNVQLNLFIEKIEQLLIPEIKNADQIGKTTEQATILLGDSRNLYSKAENLLLKELGLKDFHPKYELSYSANLSKAFGARRVDAEYFQPLYEDLMKVVAEKCSLISLGKVFNFNRGIFVPTDYYTDEKTNRPYIRIKELSGRIGIEESKVVFIKDGYPQDKNNQLKENDLVVAIIGDTIGKTNRISVEVAGGFCSNNMGRLRIKSDWANRILPEFAELAFQSLFIQRQIERGKAQTGQPKISDFEIRAIKVPMPAIKTQKEIASLIQQSHGARRKAKELLEEAKKKVENLIEGRA